MDFDRDWHTFSLDAEVDAYGTSRIAGAHNRLREENARLTKRNAHLALETVRLAELVQKYHPSHLGLPHMLRERDEARAEVKRLGGADHGLDQLEGRGEVEADRRGSAHPRA